MAARRQARAGTGPAGTRASPEPASCPPSRIRARGTQPAPSTGRRREAPPPRRPASRLGVRVCLPGARSHRPAARPPPREPLSSPVPPRPLRPKSGEVQLRAARGAAAAGSGQRAAAGRARGGAARSAAPGVTLPRERAPGAPRPRTPEARGQTRGAPAPAAPALPGRTGDSRDARSTLLRAGRPAHIAAFRAARTGSCWVAPLRSRRRPRPPPPDPLRQKCHSSSASGSLAKSPHGRQELGADARRACPAGALPRPPTTLCAGPAGEKRRLGVVTFP